MKEAQDNGYVFSPICTDPENLDFDESILKANGIYKMDLLNIPDSKLFLRKANL